MLKLHRLDTSAWQLMSGRAFALIAAAILIVQIAGLMAMGHPIICDCGHLDLWHASASGPETSQHLTDWYSFTHVGHGLLFYLLLWLVVPGAPFTIVLVMALGLEAGWEIAENTPAVIEHYRQTALAAGYFGDSVVNSVGDTLAMASGFLLARFTPVWCAVLIFFALEILLAFVIHDNLTLNIIQLIYPLDMVTQWQLSG